MGIELIEKARDTFERKQRRSLDTLDESDLFSSSPQVSVAVVAMPADGHAFLVGNWYRLALVSGRLVVLSGITTVGEVADPPSSIVDRMRTISPSLSATAAKVFALTGKVELSLEMA